MKKILTAVLLLLFVLTAFTACGENKNHSDTESSVGTNDCCEVNGQAKDKDAADNDCCSTDVDSSDETPEAESADGLQVPDSCG